MKSSKLLSIFALLAALFVVAPGCENRTEEAREDKAEAIEDRAEEVADETEGAVEEAAEKVEDKVD